MWNCLNPLPKHYLVTYSCMNIGGQQCIRKKRQILTYPNMSTSISFTLRRLKPNSTCKLNLLAVYNPASIDPGITITQRTLQKGKIYLSNKLNIRFQFPRRRHLTASRIPYAHEQLKYIAVVFWMYRYISSVAKLYTSRMVAPNWTTWSWLSPFVDSRDYIENWAR